MDALRNSRSLFELGKRREFAGTDFVKEPDEFRILGTLHFVEFQFREIAVGFGVVELERSVLRRQLRDRRLV